MTSELTKDFVLHFYKMKQKKSKNKNKQSKKSRWSECFMPICWCINPQRKICTFIICLPETKTTELLPEHQAVPEGHFSLPFLAHPETKL